jgi:hypothetical protein
MSYGTRIKRCNFCLRTPSKKKLLCKFKKKIQKTFPIVCLIGKLIVNFVFKTTQNTAYGILKF